MVRTAPRSVSTSRTPLGLRRAPSQPEQGTDLGPGPRPRDRPAGPEALRLNRTETNPKRIREAAGVEGLLAAAATPHAAASPERAAMVAADAAAAAAMDADGSAARSHFATRSAAAQRLFGRRTAQPADEAAAPPPRAHTRTATLLRVSIPTNASMPCGRAEAGAVGMPRGCRADVAQMPRGCRA